jgi:hypothetical protein
LTITFKPIETFRTEDYKANLMNSAKIKASLKEDDCPERDKLKAAIDRNENSDVAPELRIKALAEGRSLPVPATLEARFHEVQVKIRSKNDALDYLADKAKLFEIEAQKKMLDDARPQIVATEKEIFETYSKLFNQVLPYWQARCHLHGNSIRTYELFANSFDEFLGVPTDINSAWCELFRQGIAAGYISKMPPSLRPKS